MLRTVMYYIVYVIIIISLSTAIILAFRPKAGAPAYHKPITSSAATKKRAASQTPSKPSAVRQTPAPAATTTTTAGVAATNVGSNTGSLVNTGPGSLGGVFGITATVSAAGYWLHLHRKISRHNV